MTTESSPSTPVLEFFDLHKKFAVGLRMKKVEAVRGVSLSVAPGEVFGFLGPNGAGKTTTIKMAMGLIRPTQGSIQLFGGEPERLEARARVGYLPEHPYFYDYLKPTEILDFYARIFGISRSERKRRIDSLLERVGLGDVRNRTLRKFSKGMLQRVGIAQSLINDPDLLVLDEPLSGLDPIGRKEVRDLLVELRRAGKTIFFSSHILSDIEMLCDKVAIVHHGRIQSIGRMDDLLNPDQMSTEITFRASDSLLGQLKADGMEVDVLGDYMRLRIEGSTTSILSTLLEGGAQIDSVLPKRESLEDLFIRGVVQSGDTEEAS